MSDAVSVAEQAAVSINYSTVKGLAVFQEHYDRLTEEIQQALVQLDSSLPLEDGSARAEKRAEWRSWLELQIKNKSKARDGLVWDLRAQGVIVTDLPA